MEIKGKITESKFTKIGRLTDIDIYRYIGLCNMEIFIKCRWKNQKTYDICSVVFKTIVCLDSVFSFNECVELIECMSLMGFQDQKKNPSMKLYFYPLKSHTANVDIKET